MDVNGQSPLVAIKQKELQLAARLVVARQEAAQELASARAFAVQEHARAEELGRADATAELRDHIELAERDATVIRHDGEQAARAYLEQGRVLLPGAAQEIRMINERGLGSMRPPSLPNTIQMKLARLEQAMESINPTRSELLARRAQIKVAAQGRELLEQKRTVLWKELTKIVEGATRGAASAETAMAEARCALAWGAGHDEREAVESAGFAAQRNVTLEVGVANVAGVSVPVIGRADLVRSSVQRGYSLAHTSSRIDTAALRFEEVLERVVAQAAVELRLWRLAEEICATTLRVNALDMVVLPRLEAERATIEREDVFRLKRVKGRAAT
jgi:V/A-type H+-transporting ATPase subunit D